MEAEDVQDLTDASALGAGGVQDQDPREVLTVHVQDQVEGQALAMGGAQDQIGASVLAALDDQVQGDVHAPDGGDVQDQAVALALGTAGVQDQVLHGARAVQDHVEAGLSHEQVNPTLDTGRVQDQAISLTCKRKRGRTFKLKHPSSGPVDRDRINKLISLLKTRIGKATEQNESEFGRKFWRILSKKSAVNQMIHKREDVIENQEQSSMNQEQKGRNKHESGTYQEYQKAEKTSRTKHMLGLRQLKLNYSSGVICKKGRRKIPNKTSRDLKSKTNNSVTPSVATKTAFISSDIWSYFGKVKLEDNNITHLRGKVSQGTGADITQSRKTGHENQGN